MVLKTIAGIFLLSASAHLALAQSNAATQDTDSKNTAIQISEPPNPIFVLHADGKSVVVDEHVQVFDLLDVEKIASVEMIMGVEATVMYGDKAKDGVILVKLKNFSDLPAQLRPTDGDGE